MSASRSLSGAETMTQDRDPIDATRALLEQGARGVLLFDSGRATSHDSTRWSMLMHDPVLVLTFMNGRFVELDSCGDVTREVAHPVEWLREHAASAPHDATYDEDGDRIPFVGGLAGFLGFGFARELDSIELVREGLGQMPLLWVGKYESAQMFKHVPLDVTSLQRPGFVHRAPVIMASDGCAEGLDEVASGTWYRARVEACIAAIVERGDLFEVNYTERLTAPVVKDDAFAFYERLRGRATGDYMGFMELGEVQLASISPEQFLSCCDGVLTARPIKGTMRRDEDDEVRDGELAQELLRSQKDRAENIMIVDLMRNDLTRVARLGSVRATEICALESFAGVHHLVSTVRGELDQGCTPMEALLASFPAGSITGAPKLRAMEYIAEYEASPRGAYTGSMFYASQCGQLDSNVLIRTVEILGDVMRYGAGGAVVSDSDAESEWQEALLKAALFLGAAVPDEQEE